VAEIEIEEQCLAVAFFGNQHDAGAGGIARRSKRDRGAVDADLAGGRSMQAEDRFEQLGAAGSDETEDAGNLAAPHAETDAPKIPRPGQVIGRQPRLTRLRPTSHFVLRRDRLLFPLAVPWR
jgi:hypothetical protein